MAPQHDGTNMAPKGSGARLVFWACNSVTVYVLTITQAADDDGIVAELGAIRRSEDQDPGSVPWRHLMVSWHFSNPYIAPEHSMPKEHVENINIVCLYI